MMVLIPDLEVVEVSAEELRQADSADFQIFSKICSVISWAVEQGAQELVLLVGQICNTPWKYLWKMHIKAKKPRYGYRLMILAIHVAVQEQNPEQELIHATPAEEPAECANDKVYSQWSAHAHHVMVQVKPLQTHVKNAPAAVRFTRTKT